MKTTFELIVVAALILSVAAGPGIAQTVDYEAMEQAETVAGGAWHFTSIPCSDGTVSDVGPRLQTEGQKVFTPQDYEQSGVAVGISFAQPWHYLAQLTTKRTGVVHYQGTVGNDIMRAERRGDRVQVCLTAFPAPRVDPATKRVLCNPDKDGRGYIFRVYDYRQHAAYIGPNSEHTCGGA